MWSGSMSSQGEPFSSQMVGSWALNPSIPYMNVPHEQVDWASLAQQWIKMKEEVPQYDKEGGEAPMDIIKEDNAITTPPNPPDWPTTNTADGTWSGNWSWNQAGGGWCWSSVGQQIAKPTVPSTFTPTYPAIPEVSAPIIPQTSTFPYTPPQAPTSNETFPPNHTYWTGATPEGKDVAWDSHRAHKKHPEQTPEIDPAKRKQLPAWIREGLEKMEREKLKKAENERLEKLRKDELARQSDLQIVDSNGLIEEHPSKSKFETESDDSDNGGETTDLKIKSEEKPRRSRFDWHESAATVLPQQKFRSKEQILQSVMVDVRKILTQVLMEVTTEEIQKAVDEEIKHFKRKAPATTVRKTAALTSLTGKLGLGIYESDSDSESDPEEKVKNDPDSDQELRDRIEKLKNEFLNVEKAIEIEAAEQEERERKQLKYESLNKEENSSNHEEQVQPLREASAESGDKNRTEEHAKEISDHKRINRLSDSSKSENFKESTSSSTSNNNSSKTSKKLVSSERSYRRSSSSYSSSAETTSSSSSSSRSSGSRYRRRRNSGKRSGGDRRSSRYTRSRSRTRSRSHSRTRRDRSRHGSECRRRTRRRSSRDRKGRNRRSSSTSSNGHHRSRKSNHRR